MNEKGGEKVIKRDGIRVFQASSEVKILRLVSYKAEAKQYLQLQSVQYSLWLGLQLVTPICGHLLPWKKAVETGGCSVFFLENCKWGHCLLAFGLNRAFKVPLSTEEQNAFVKKIFHDFVCACFLMLLTDNQPKALQKVLTISEKPKTAVSYN